MRFTRGDIAAFELGAAVLGGGGGGEPYLGAIMLGELLSDGRTVEIRDVEDLGDEDEVAPFALVGSPHAIAEKLLGRAEVTTLFEGGPVRRSRPTAVMPYEMAGLNALYPLAAAAMLGVPCIDGDFTGRGVPSLDITVLELDDAQPDAYLLCDSRSRTVAIQKSGALSMERLVRPVVETMGWLAAFSTSSLDAAFCRRHALRGTLSRCLRLGRVFSGLAALEPDAAREALAGCGAVLAGSGRVTERLSSSDALGPRASLAIEADDTGEPALRVELRNEFHLAVRDGVVLASTPDILVVADRISWAPLSTEDVAPGRDVHVIALPADERWHSESGIRLAGPRAFGYGVDHVDFRSARYEEGRR